MAAQGTTPVLGPNQVVAAREAGELKRLRISPAGHFSGDFGIVLLMGPHQRSGYKQIIESIRADRRGVRIVAFESPPANGGEPSQRYRTFTLWMLPDALYRRGLGVTVVTPSNAPVAFTALP